MRGFIPVVLGLSLLAGPLKAQECRETADVQLCNRVTQLEHRVTALEDTVTFYRDMRGEFLEVRYYMAERRILIDDFARYMFRRMSTHERLFTDMGYKIFIKPDTLTKD